MENKQGYNSVQIRSKISSTGGSISKFGIVLLSIFLLLIFYNLFDFSFMAFMVFIVTFSVFFYVYVNLFYDPKVMYDDEHILFKRFNRPSETISFKQVVRLSQNAQAYTRGLPGNYYYRIDFIQTNGKSKSISFYSEESQEIEIKQLIESIRSVNPHFIVDWTVPQKVRE